MDTAATSITIFSISNAAGAVSAYAVQPVVGIVICALGTLVAIAPVVRGRKRDREEDELLRHIITTCGPGSKEFKNYTEVLRVRAKGPP
jgi:hypothetical protein